MKTYAWRDFPVAEARRLLEPGPIVLVSSAWRGERNVMTMGWHMMMEFTPALVGCIIAEGNHSFEMVRRSRECVINVPEAHLAAAVVGIGNSSGRDLDKFARYGLTALPAAKVAAPLIGQCHACLECRLADARLVRRYNMFVFEVVKAHAATRPKHPRTLHYRGNGEFMVAGANLARYRRRFRPDYL